MKNALILHGAGNNSKGNWFPWLKNELENKGYNVWVPDLPNSNEPIKSAWLNTIFSNKEWVFDENSLIIGHSAGATLVLRILENLPDNVKINKTVLVSGVIELGTNPDHFIYKQSMVADSFDWEKIKRSAKHFYFIHSDNDQYECGDDQGKIMHDHLGGELIIKKGERHFNLENGPQYKQFLFLLTLI